MPFCLRTGRRAATGEGQGEGHVVHFAVPSVQELWSRSITDQSHSSDIPLYWRLCKGELCDHTCLSYD